MKKQIVAGLIALSMIAGMALVAGPASADRPRGKVTICHKGKTISVNAHGARAHLRNHKGPKGDHEGRCKKT